MPRCLSVGAVIAGNSKMVLKAGFLRLQATAWWSWSDSNQPPKCYGTWLVSDQLPWSDTHPDRRAFVVFRDYPGSWSDSNEQPDVKESGSSPTSPPRRTLFISVRLCGNDILLGLPLPLFSGPKIPFPGNREADCGDPGRPKDEMLPSRFGRILAAGRRVALPGARLERGIKLRINRAVPMG